MRNLSLHLSLNPLFLLLFLGFLGFAPQFPVHASLLKPLKLDHPRDTMTSFMEAMKDYKAGSSKNSSHAKARLRDAVRTLDLAKISSLIRAEKGPQLAILLKEIIDRVIIIDNSKIPADKSLPSWRLKGTEIIISLKEGGDQAGMFLFSKETVAQIEDFYSQVKHRPYLKGSGGGAGFSDPWHVRYFPESLKEETLGVLNWQWIGLFFAIMIGLLLKKILEQVVHSILKVMRNKDARGVRYGVLVALEKPLGLLGATAFWFFAVVQMKFDGFFLLTLLGSAKIAFCISMIWALYGLIDVVVVIFERMADKTESTLDDQLVPILKKTLRIFVVLIGSLATLQNLGVNVMSLLAGLGLGGLAFALAAKDTAANFFGSLMILIDAPFRVGDWVITDGAEGTVEEIGFRSTRLRTFYDSVICIPNSAMANINIDNMGKRTYRRIRTNIGLTYSTPPEKLEKFIAGTKSVILKNEFTRKDYFHVVFNGFGPYSLDIMFYCFLEVKDWSQELLEKQNLFLELIHLAKELDVEFAFPTQSLFVETLKNNSPQPPLVTDSKGV